MSKLQFARSVSPLALSFALALPPSHALAQTTELPAVDATAQGGADAPQIPFAQSSPNTAGPAPIVQRYQLPQTTESVTAKRINETVNILDSEDAVKYLPSLFVRKRNYGDTQPVLATRTFGVSSSARSLVYADDILISALLANNNTIGAPRWGLVAPEEIERVDFMYGPFAAAYPGNSIGGVLVITTKMPDHLTMTAKQTEAFQTFSQYDTSTTYRTDQSSATMGDKIENFSWFLSANVTNSYAQPLTYATGTTLPPGAIPALNKFGGVANVFGDTSVLHTQMANVKLKLAYDFTPWLRGSYILGYWSNDGNSSVNTYLRTAGGASTFAGQSAFAAGYYNIREKHLANAVSLTTDTHGPFDADASVSFYDYLEDIQRQPFGVTPNAGFTYNGRITSLDGTNWVNADLKANWRPFGLDGAHLASFGLHGDQYNLVNPTYATPNWNGGYNAGRLYTDGVGATRTGALWAQDVWRFAPGFSLTLGGRLESWRAFGGFNLQTTTATVGGVQGVITGTKSAWQPSAAATYFSPKATLSYQINPEWEVKGSFAESYRFPTVSELYQAVTSGTTIVIPNANLTPEQDFSEELSLERRWVDGHARLSLFNENVNNFILSQSNIDPINQLAVTTFTNVDKVRMTGVEVALDKDNVLVHGLQVFGSVTYLNARIVSDSNAIGSVPGTASFGRPISVDGNWVPNVPDWKVTLGATYRPDEHWAFTLVGRYSGKLYTTVDNADKISGVYQAFDRFLVLDARIHYAYNENISFNFGVDNLNNDKFFFFHPFPQRTFVVDARIKF